MAEGHLKVILVPAGPVGMEAGLASVITATSIVTSFHDAILVSLRHVAEDLPDAEILTFGSIVGRFVRMTGEADLALTNSGHAEAMIARIAPNFAPEEPLSKAVQRLGTIRMIHSQLGEFRDWDISPSDLRAVAETADPSLATRLRFVADVSETLEDELQKQGRGFASALVKRCLASDFSGTVPDRHVICLTGPGEHPLYEAWLRWLTTIGVNVDVIVEAPSPDSNLFASSARTIARLGGAQQTEGNPSWADGLFRKTVGPSGPTISAIEATDPMLETEWVVRDAIQDVAEGIMPFRIGFFARDVDTYAPLLLAAADRLGLPISTSLSVPLLATGFARLTQDILSALCGSDVRRVARLASSSYLQVTPAAREELWAGMREAHRKKMGAWGAAAEFAEKNQEAFPWLHHILVWRAEAAESAWSLAKWSAAIRTLLTGTDIVDLSLEGTERSRLRDVRAQTVLQRSIAERATAVGEHVTFTFRHFLAFANRVWQDETVFAPFGTDGVQICQSTQQLQAFDAVYALGMVEGTMPRRRHEGAMFSDIERNFISDALGLNARLLTSRDESKAERDEFVRLAASGKKKIIFSYPDTSDQRETVKTFYIDEAERAAGGHIDTVIRTRSQTIPEAADCRTPADSAMRAAFDGPRTPPTPVRLRTEVAQSAVRVRLNDGVSLSEISDAVACPFRGVASHRLALTEPARGEGLRSLLRIPERAALAVTRDEESARASVLKELEGRIDELFPLLEPWEVSLLQSAGVRLADEWVAREFAAREQWGLKPGNTKQGQPIREPDLKTTFKVGSREFKLTGTIPSLTQTDEFSLITMFVSSDPALFHFENSKEHQQARYGLLFLSQYGRKPNIGVQVDILGDTRGSGKRIVYTLNDYAPLAFKPSPTDGLLVNREQPRAFLEAAKQAIGIALEALDNGTIDPKPSDVCQYCGYGELCRSSSEFGEQVSDSGGSE